MAKKTNNKMKGKSSTARAKAQRKSIARQPKVALKGPKPHIVPS